MSEIDTYISKCRELSQGGEYSWWSRLAELLEEKKAIDGLSVRNYTEVTRMAEVFIDNYFGDEVEEKDTISIIRMERSFAAGYLARVEEEK